MRRRRPLFHSALSVWALFLSLAIARASETSASLEKPNVRPAPASGEKAGRSEAETPVVSSAATGTAAKSAAENAAEIRSLLKLGASLGDRGEYESAEIAFRQVMNGKDATVSDLQDALLGLAHMHRREGALTKAVAIYDSFLKDYPGDLRCPEVLLDLGRTLRSMGAYKGAIARFYGVINATLKLPSVGFARYQLLAKTAQFEIAETHFQAGEFAEASKFFARLRLLDLAPADRASAQFKSAHAQELQGDHEGAIASLRAYLVQWPEDENVPEARYLLAVALRALNRREEAFSETLELLRAEKSQLASNHKLWIYWQRRTGNQLANDFFESGETFNAQIIYNSLVALSDDPAWRLPITYQIGLCHERLGNVDQARASYQSIIDTAGANAPANLAEIARMAGWHLEQLNWREKFGQKVTAFFETTTGSGPRHGAAPPPKSAAVQ